MSRTPRGRGSLSPGQFDRIAKALADPRRFALLQAIAAESECPCQQLIRQFPVTKATISHHAKELLRAGLIEAQREGQCVFFTVRREVLEQYTAELLRRVGPSTGVLTG